MRKLKPAAYRIPSRDEWRSAMPAVLGNALSGPALGVASFQWALRVAKTGIVLPIVATSPLVTMMLVWFLDGSRPSRRAVAGGVIAVCGAVALSMVRGQRV
jgi:drug/metabolite transporter (DMT)-like permease